MFPPVFQTLTANSDVAALVEHRIFRHGEAPEGVEAPYVTWFVVSAPPEKVLDGKPRVDRYELQIDCWSSNDGGGDAEVEQVAQAVRDALEVDRDMSGVLFNGKDPDTRRYRIAMGVTWWLSR